MSEQEKPKRKRNLLPTWIKVFLWIFLVMASFMPIIIVLGLIGYPTNISLYGFESNSVFSAIGFILTCLITYKGFIAYGLWYEKKLAVTHAINDAIIGIVVCILSMILPLFLYDGMQFTFRLELIALIPYLFKMKEIKNEWNDELPNKTLNSDDLNEDMTDIIEELKSIYTTHTYQCEDGIITIDQEFQNPNIGEKVFLNEKPAPFGKYKLGFMVHIFVDNGIIEKISSF